MRIAVIADIHGNLSALESVLADIDHRGADHIVCLGDGATMLCFHGSPRSASNAAPPAPAS